MAIAFPLEGLIQNSSANLPHQPVFAYLPLRSYGFRFILQADFEIPASRQDLRHDNLWNEWLRSHMHELIWTSYCTFERLSDLIADLNFENNQFLEVNRIQTIKYFLKFIPELYAIEPYFEGFINKSLKVLAGKMELPVIRRKIAGQTETIWVQPSQCIIVRDDFTRSIITEELLLLYRNCYYLHDDLMEECNEKRLTALGCRTLELSDITDLIESSYKSMEQACHKNEANIKQGRIFLDVFFFSLKSSSY